MKSLFVGKDGAFIALSDGSPNALMKMALTIAIPGTVVGGVSKNGDAYTRFDLSENAPKESLILDVIYLKRHYRVTIPAVRMGEFHILDGQPFRISSGTLLHAFGITEDGNMVSFPAFYKKLGEVTNCTRCPFWATNMSGEKECSMLRWQPAGLHHLNEPQCSAGERNRRGIRLIKVYDHYGDLEMSNLAQAIWAAIRKEKNATTPKMAKVIPVTPEERMEKTSKKIGASAAVLEFDHKLAEAGCEFPLFHLSEDLLKSIVLNSQSLRETAQAINAILNDGNELTIERVRSVEDEVRDDLDPESLDWLLENGLV